VTPRAARTATGEAATTSDTGAVLRRMRALLVAGALVVCAVSGVLCYGAFRSAQTVARSGSQAVSGVGDARRALVEADREAVSAFGAGDVRLAGPGDDYLGQITLAGQSLERVAEANQAGTDGSETLRLVDGLLSTYSGMVELAHAAYASNQPKLGDADVWYASHFMHDAHTGVLATLNVLEQRESDALRAQADRAWNRPWTVLVWAVPALGLLAGLVVAQLYLSRRFRRTLNVSLLAASVVLVAAIVAGGLFALAADHGVSTALRGAEQARVDRTAQTDAADVVGQRALGALMRARCPTDAGACGVTVAAFEAGLGDLGPPGRAPLPVGSAVPVDAQVVEANTDPDLARADLVGGSLVAGCAAVVALLVLIGLWQRIDEYRYQR
jgi:hypothetical protein